MQSRRHEDTKKGDSFSKREVAIVVAAIFAAGSTMLAAQRGGGRGAAAPPASARAAAPVDLTGWWVSVVTEDWRFRMVTPPKGDYASVPLNAEGRRVADMWDPSSDGLCDAYGAAGLMRMPGRLHITWQDDNTLKIETDAGQQTRLLRFGAAPPTATAERTLQGYSMAQWVGGAPLGGGGFGGFGGNVVAPEAASAGRGQGGAAAAGGARAAGAGGTAASAPPAGAAGPPAAAGGGNRGAAQRWGVLRVTTTQLKPGWLRKNGVPYSDKTTLTENFMRFADGADEWFTVSTIVDDPTYLNQTFITSTNFKREPDGARWKAAPCRTGQ